MPTLHEQQLTENKYLLKWPKRLNKIIDKELCQIITEKYVAIDMLYTQVATNTYFFGGETLTMWTT